MSKNIKIEKIVKNRVKFPPILKNLCFFLEKVTAEIWQL